MGKQNNLLYFPSPKKPLREKLKSFLKHLVFASLALIIFLVFVLTTVLVLTLKV